MHREATAAPDVRELTPTQYEARKARLRDQELLERRRRLYTFNAVCPLKLTPDLPADAAAQRRGGRPRRATTVADPYLAQWGEMAKPPLGNTGAACPETDGLFKTPGIKVDWLNVTFPSERLPEVRGHVEAHFGHAQDRLFGKFSYRDSAVCEDGALLAWSEGRGEALLSINADALDTLDPDRQLALVKWLYARGAKGTRMDVAFDDYQRIAPIGVIRANANAGNFSGFKWVDGHCPHDPLSGERKGDSVEFGTRGRDGSGAFLRIYDKGLESGGHVDCIRYEVEFCGDKAQAGFELLAHADSQYEYARTMGGLLTGVIDFRLREGYEKKFARAPRLDWWQRILDLIQSPIIRVKTSQMTARLQQAVDACKQQYGRTLAYVRVLLQSMPTPVNLAAVVDAWCDGYEPRINWDRQGKRDTSLSLPALLAT